MENSINHSTLSADLKYSKLAKSDYVVLFFVIALLLIDFVPYLGSMIIGATQFLYLTILNVIIGIYIYTNPQYLSLGFLKQLKSSLLLKFYYAFIGLSAISILFAKNASLGLVNLADILVVFTLIINFCLLLFNKRHLSYKICVLVAISAFFQGSIALINFYELTQWKSFQEALNSKYLKGNTGNINIFSASLMFKIPFIYIAILHYKHWMNLLLALSVIAASAVILLNSARASLLSLLIITVLFCSYLILKRSNLRRLVQQLVLILLPILISYSVVNYVFKQQAQTGRYSSTIERINQININESSVTARFVFYKIALDLAIQHPLVGVGLGNYRIESIPKDLLSDTTIALNVHNDFLELAAETGFLNALIYLALFLLLGIINIKRFNTKSANQQHLAVLSLMLLIVYGIDATFNFPMYRATMQICFCFLMVFTFINSSITGNGFANNRAFLATLILLAVLPLYVTYHAYNTSKLESRIYDDNINYNSSGVLTGEKVENFKPKFPNVFSSSESFVEYAGIYYFRAKNYDLALKMLDSAKIINPYLGRPDFYKSAIFEEMGQLDSTYHYLKAAYQQRPTNLFFLDKLLTYASMRKDTTQILKIYASIPSTIKSISIWEKITSALNESTYSDQGLKVLFNNAFLDFPQAQERIKTHFTALKIAKLNNEGNQLIAEKLYDKGLQKFNEALKIDSNNVYVMQSLGMHYFQRKAYDKAIIYFKNAIALPGLSDGKTQYFIGLSYEAIGDFKNACNFFYQAGLYPGAMDKKVKICGQ